MKRTAITAALFVLSFSACAHADVFNRLAAARSYADTHAATHGETIVTGDAASAVEYPVHQGPFEGHAYSPATNCGGTCLQSNPCDAYLWSGFGAERRHWCQWPWWSKHTCCGDCGCTCGDACCAPSVYKPIFTFRPWWRRADCGCGCDVHPAPCSCQSHCASGGLFGGWGLMHGKQAGGCGCHQPCASHHQRKGLFDVWSSWWAKCQHHWGGCETCGSHDGGYLGGSPYGHEGEVIYEQAPMNALPGPVYESEPMPASPYSSEGEEVLPPANGAPAEPNSDASARRMPFGGLRSLFSTGGVR